MTGFVAKVIRRVSLVVQELLALLENRVHTWCLVLNSLFYSVVCFIVVRFLLSVVISVL